MQNKEDAVLYSPALPCKVDDTAASHHSLSPGNLLLSLEERYTHAVTSVLQGNQNTGPSPLQQFNKIIIRAKVTFPKYQNLQLAHGAEPRGRVRLSRALHSPPLAHYHLYSSS